MTNKNVDLPKTDMFSECVLCGLNCIDSIDYRLFTDLTKLIVSWRPRLLDKTALSFYVFDDLH